MTVTLDHVTTDRYGNPTEDETSVTARAYVQPVKTSEETVNRDTRVTGYNVFLRPDEDVDALSRIVWEGITLNVVGKPSRFDTPRGAHHIELLAEVVDG